VREADMPETAALEFRLDELLGCEVRARNGSRVGMLQELHCSGDTPYDITEYVIGLAGLLDRLHIIRAVLSLKARGYVANAGQIDLSEPSKPTLTCDLAELRKL
jgi:hypothetical protein